MVTTVRATIRDEDGHQVIVLPDDIRFEANEVLLTRNKETGDLTISTSHDRTTALREFFAYVEANPIPDEEWEAFDRAWKEGRETDLPEDDDEIVRLLLDEE
jgi:hypothetical protein